MTMVATRLCAACRHTLRQMALTHADAVEHRPGDRYSPRIPGELRQLQPRAGREHSERIGIGAHAGCSDGPPCARSAQERVGRWFSHSVDFRVWSARVVGHEGRVRIMSPHGDLPWAGTARPPSNIDGIPDETLTISARWPASRAALPTTW